MVVKYFRELFKLEISRESIDWRAHFNHIQIRLSDSRVNVLNAPFSDLEVQASIIKMAPIKAPGPNGFSAVFFQKCWSAIRNEIT